MNKKKENVILCNYNHGVEKKDSCIKDGVPNCERCGWNPANDELRRKMVHKRYPNM